MAAWQIERHEARIDLGGDLGISDGDAIWRSLQAAATTAPEELNIDLSHVVAIDGSVMAWVAELRASLIAQDVRCEIVGGDEHIRDLVRLFGGDRPVPRRLARPKIGMITRLGLRVQQGVQHSVTVVSFFGELVDSLRRPLGINSRAIPGLVSRAGTDGIPIVLLLNFLVGFVMAFQSVRTLKLYGADIYVADIVGISVARELTPLMTAIIIAGRSGAAYAAELGTMRVSEELDALRTLGLAPMSYLVVPRIIALALVAPILTLIGDVIGVGGGMFVASTSLGITPAGFINELRTIVVASDVWTGLVKSLAFGSAIALIGCQHGLTTRGAAEGVGRGTTATVVQCLFMIVFLDTVFTVIFQEFNV